MIVFDSNATIQAVGQVEWPQRVTKLVKQLVMLAVITLGLF